MKQIFTPDKNVPWDDQATCESSMKGALEGSLSASFGGPRGTFDYSQSKYDTNTISASGYNIAPHNQGCGSRR